MEGITPVWEEGTKVGRNIRINETIDSSMHKTDRLADTRTGKRGKNIREIRERQDGIGWQEKNILMIEEEMHKQSIREIEEK